MNTPNVIPTAPVPILVIPVQARPARSSRSGLPLLKCAVVKRHALGCVRAGMGRKKFTRCGQGFIDEVQAEFDSILCGFLVPYLGDERTQPPAPAGILSRKLRNKVISIAETLAARLIERKVVRHPAIGKTLLAIRG